MTQDNPTQPRYRVAANSGVVLFCLYATLLLLLEVSETCTMGGEGQLVNLIVGAPLATVSGLLLFAGSRVGGIDRRLVLIPAFIALSVYHVEQAYRISFSGQRYCDTYTELAPPDIERWIPVLFLGMLAAVAWAAWPRKS